MALKEELEKAAWKRNQLVREYDKALIELGINRGVANYILSPHFEVEARLFCEEEGYVKLEDYE